MSWLSNLFGGGPDGGRASDPTGEDEGTEGRLRQLREGVRAAVAALPEAHANLGEDAVRAADSLLARARAAGTGAGEGSAEGDESTVSTVREAVDRLELLHFQLIRIEVEGADPGELEVSDTLDELRRLAGELEERAGAADRKGGDA